MDIISVSESALEKIKEYFSKNEKTPLRIFVATG